MLSVIVLPGVQLTVELTAVVPTVTVDPASMDAVNCVAPVPLPSLALNTRTPIEPACELAVVAITTLLNVQAVLANVPVNGPIAKKSSPVVSSVPSGWTVALNVPLACLTAVAKDE